MSRILFRTLTGSAGRVGLCAALLGGCSSAPEVSLEPADVQAQIDYTLGTILGAPGAGASSGIPFEEAYSWTLDVLGLDELPETALRPLSEQMSLAFVLDDGHPVVAPLYLARGARSGPIESREAFLEALGNPRPLRRVVAALPPGVTAEVRLRLAESTAEPPRSQTPALEARAYRGELTGRSAPDLDAVAFTWVLEGFGPRTDAFSKPRASELGREGPIGESFRSEVLLTQTYAVGDGLQLATVLLAPFERHGGESVLLLATISPPPAPRDPGFEEHSAALSACRDAVAALVDARDSRDRDGPGAAKARQIEMGLRELAESPNRRATLAFLAGTTGAVLVEDVALAASDDLVKALVARVLDARRSGMTSEELGWTLVSQLLGEAIERQQDDGLDPELSALLTRHMGEAGSHPLFLESAISSCGSLRQLEARLAEENTLYLHSTSLAARIRAYRWLEARGMAPPGYEPGTYFEEGKAASLEALEGARLEPARSHE